MMYHMFYKSNKFNEKIECTTISKLKKFDFIPRNILNHIESIIVLKILTDQLLKIFSNSEVYKFDLFAISKENGYTI